MRRLGFSLFLLAVCAASFWASQALAQWGSRGCSPVGPVGPQNRGFVPDPDADGVIRLHLDKAPRLPNVGGKPQKSLNGPDQIWLQVELDDPTAELFLGGKRMQQTGLVRNFVSPALPPGRYTYTVEVHWPDAMLTRVVECRPGQAVRVRLERPRRTTGPQA